MDGQEFSTIYLPKKIIEEAMKRGYDIESLVIDSIVKKLRIDPEEEADIHIELAERYLDEARRYIDRGDPVQASEKLYKVAEECIKALAIELRAPEVDEAKRG
jgi:PaREP1/PaREP8 domain containing family protein